MPRLERGRPTRRERLEASGHAKQRNAICQICKTAKNEPCAERHAEWCEPWPALDCHEDQNSQADCQCRRGPEPLQHGKEVRALPTQQCADGHEQKERQHDGAEGEIEVWRSHGDFFAGDGFKRQGIKCSDQNRSAGGAEEKIVQHKAPFPADGREESARFERRRAPGKECERAADKETQYAEDENAARRINGEGVNRRQHAGAHQEGAEQ